EELVAAHPRDEVVRGYGRAEPFRYDPQYLIAARVTARVVDALEEVEVEIDDPEQPMAVRHLREQARHSVLHVEPVRQARERVALSLLREAAAVRALQLFGAPLLVERALLQRDEAQYERDGRDAERDE